MNNIIKILTFICVLFSTQVTYTQTDTLFNGYFSPLIITGSAPNWDFKAKFRSKQFDISSLGTDCKVIISVGQECFELDIATITSTSNNVAEGTLTGTSDTDILKGRIGAVFRPTDTRQLKPFVAGIPEELQSCISNLNFIELDTTIVPDSVITSASLVDGSVTESKIASNAVSEVKIEDDAVTENKISDDAVTESKIADNSITNNKLAGNSVTADKTNLIHRDTVSEVSFESEIDDFNKEILYTDVSGNDVTIELPTPTESLAGRTVRVYHKGNSALGVTNVQTDGIEYDLLVNQDTAQQFVFISGVEYAFDFECVYDIDFGYRWKAEQVEAVYYKSDNKPYSIDPELGEQQIRYDYILGSTSEISDVKAREGQEILVPSENKRYVVVEDTVQYYPVDADRVIELANGKYAVQDLSTKRQFKTKKEFMKLIPLCDFSGGVEKVEIEGLPAWVSASPLFIGKPVVNDTLPSFFQDVVSVNVDGINELEETEWYGLIGAATGNSVVNANYLKQQIGPTGRRNAIGVYYNGSDNVGNFFAYVNDKIGNLTDDGIFSVYVKGTDENTTISCGGCSTAYSVTTEYQRYIFSPSSPSSFIQMNISGLSSGDTVFISQPQHEPATASGNPTPYKPSHLYYPFSGSINKVFVNYAYELVENGDFRVDKFSSQVDREFRRFGDDTDLIRAARDYCYGGIRCNGIQLGKGIYYTSDSIRMSEKVLFKGIPSSRKVLSNGGPEKTGTSIYVNISDPTKSAFIFESSGDSFSGGGIEDLNINVIDTIANIVDATEINDVFFRNITVSTTLNGKYGVGLNLQVQGGSDQYWNTIENVDFLGGNYDIGIIYEGSTANRFRHIEVNGADSIGIWIKGGNNFTAFDLLLQHCETALKVDGGNKAYINELYTEGSGFSDGAVIKMNGGGLTLVNSTLQSKTTFDTLFSISGGDFFTVENSIIRTFGESYINNNTDVDFADVASTVPLYYMPFGVQPNVGIDGNSDASNDAIIYPSKTKGDFVDGVVVNNSTARKLHLADTTFAGNLIFAGNRENLIHRSDSLLSGTFGVGDTIVVKKDNFEAPDGTNTAETVIYSGNSIGGGTIAWCAVEMPADSFSVGDKYIFSFDVFFHQQESRAFNFVEVRPFSIEANDINVAIRADSGQWERIYIHGEIQSIASAANELVLRFDAGLDAGDSLSIANIQLSRGDTPTGFVPTSGTFISDDSLNVELDGDVQITGDLTGPTIDTLNQNIGEIGTFSETTDVSGDISISNPFDAAPTIATAEAHGTTQYTLQYVPGSSDASNVVFRVFDSSGTAVASGAVTGSYKLIE